tara:strand:+ start:1189 stop:3165 length:1977 start_codon:yes stop_codon:yes gene_type:complete
MHIKTNGFQPINLNQNEIQPKDIRTSFSSFGVLGNFKRELGLFSALTLPLILAACGGGGGGGAVSPTPDSGSGSSGSGSGDSGSDSSATSGTDLDGGSYAATADADTFIIDVSFDGTSVVSLDNDSIITGFDPSNDTILLRGSGAPASFDAAALVGSTGVEVQQSTIDNNTVIYFSPNSSNASASITLAGVLDGDLSSISVSAEDGSANDSTASTPGGTDLSSGTVAATDSADAFVYEIKFVDGSPVAIDGEVVITGFDASTDTLTLQASSVPSGFSKSSLLTATGVDVTTNTIDNYTLISFAPDSSGASGSIRIDGVVDGDLSSLNINILSGSVSSAGTDLSSGSNIELGTTDLTAQADAENFVFDATYSDSTISGSDGPVTITGFDQSKDKIVILASAMPVGYDLDDFKLASGIDIQSSAIDNNTVIYFAPDENGNSTSLTLAGVVDGDLGSTSIVFTSSLSGETSSGTATSTDTGASSESTSTSDTSSSDSSSTDSSSTDSSSTDSSSTDSSSTDSSATTFNVIEIATATADTEITGTDGADEFRYEFADSGTNATSSEGNFKITITDFDSSNDKIVFVNVGGSDLTVDEFKALGGVEISGNSFDNQTRILFGQDSSGGSGELAVNGIYDADLTSITIEVLADSNLTASSSGDFG